ncbi:MAG: hypothetical protein EPN43_06415 [Jatrophihabitans sp.]|nr:MAG: hypothetical protein EPN43_06415 [Jatrophihabitans sp.]
MIRGLYRQVAAPDWAAPNLDGLADVLRDLSWLPPGPVLLEMPDMGGLAPVDRDMLLGVLRSATAESAGSPHPIRIVAAHG